MMAHQTPMAHMMHIYNVEMRQRLYLLAEGLHGMQSPPHHASGNSFETR
jgi:hypothetical protein